MSPILLTVVVAAAMTISFVAGRAHGFTLGRAGRDERLEEVWRVRMQRTGRLLGAIHDGCQKELLAKLQEANATIEDLRARLDQTAIPVERERGGN